MMMTRTNGKQTVEVVSVTDHRLRRCSVTETAALVRQTHESEMGVSLVARQNGISASF